MALRASIGSRRRSVPLNSNRSKAYRKARGSFCLLRSSLEGSHPLLVAAHHLAVDQAGAHLQVVHGLVHGSGPTAANHRRGPQPMACSCRQPSWHRPPAVAFSGRYRPGDEHTAPPCARPGLASAAMRSDRSEAATDRTTVLVRSSRQWDELWLEPPCVQGCDGVGAWLRVLFPEEKLFFSGKKCLHDKACGYSGEAITDSAYPPVHPGIVG